MRDLYAKQETLRVDLGLSKRKQEGRIADPLIWFLKIYQAIIGKGIQYADLWAWAERSRRSTEG